MSQAALRAAGTLDWRQAASELIEWMEELLAEAPLNYEPTA